MKKAKLFLSLISSAIIASTTVLGASAAHYKGDIDRNDQVTLSDVVSIQKHLSGKSSIDKDKLIYADMNDDSKINVFDLILAKRVVIGDIEKEEVPSLTTPVVTTTITTTTTKPTTAATTTKATTAATTTKATTAATTTTKATTKATTTKATTAATTTTKATTKATTTETSYEETTTVAATKATTTKAGITTAETTKAEVTTNATIATTTTVKETTVTTTTSKENAAIGTTLTFTINQSEKISIPIDSEKELDYIEFEFDTSADFGFHAYIDNWTTYFNITNTSGTLSESNLRDNIQAVTIDGNKVKVEFKEGVSGQILYFQSNYNTIKFTVTNIAYVGDTGTEPVETTVTSDEIVETTETTVTTVTETTITTTTSTEETTTVAETDATTVTTTVSDSSDTVQTGVAGTDVNRGALIVYGDNSLVVDKDYYAALTDESGIAVPEITGNGTYTVKFTLSEPNIITWLELRLLSGTSGKALNSLNYSNLDVTIDSFKADGVETTKSLDSVSKNIANWDGASVTIMNLLDSTTVNKSIEVTFTVTGIE